MQMFWEQLSYVDSGSQFPFIFLCYYPLGSHRLLLNPGLPGIKEGESDPVGRLLWAKPSNGLSHPSTLSWSPTYKGD